MKGRIMLNSIVHKTKVAISIYNVELTELNIKVISAATTAPI